MRNPATPPHGERSRLALGIVGGAILAVVAGVWYATSSLGPPPAAPQPPPVVAHTTPSPEPVIAPAAEPEPVAASEPEPAPEPPPVAAPESQPAQPAPAPQQPWRRATQADFDAILDGVSHVGVPGWPGIVCAFGPESFPLVAGSASKRLAPVAAATRFGEGRAVMFGHDGYMSAGILGKDDHGRLMVQAVRWAAGARTIPDHEPRIATLKVDALRAHLASRGLDVMKFGDNWHVKLEAVDVVCTDPARLGGESDVAALRKFVRAGGGLVVAGTGWGWCQIHKRPITEYPGNLLLAPAGLVQANSGAGATASGKRMAVANPPPELCQAAWALEKLTAHSRDEAKLTREQIGQAVYTVTLAAQNLPEDDELLMPRLEELVANLGEAAYPMPDRPLRQDTSGLASVAVVLENKRLRELAPEEMAAHPAARGFPYAVADDAPRVTRTVTVDAARPNWHSTGLYAPPGELITVTVDQRAAAAGLTVRLGCHQDRLWHLDRWSRWPELTFVKRVTSRETKVANPFGGPVYVDVPRGCKIGTTRVEIAGAVEAPWYVLGRTTADEWRDAVRSRPAPWAELECERIILTVPSKVVRDLEDPEPLMKNWDRVVELEDELAGYEPGFRKRPERMVCDQQISAGYMHSGYPIMTGLDVIALNVNASKLFEKGKTVGWGHWHELGHNHQSGDWTFDGTVEVTVNLFTLYVLEHLHGVKLPEVGWGPLRMERRLSALKSHLKTGQPIRDVGLWLVMYAQMIEGFGWQPMKDVFVEYRKLPQSERPKSQAQKRDQWMVRYSKRVNRNLGPFFQKWGVPTTEAARKSIAHLPVWMPPDFDRISWSWRDEWKVTHASSQNADGNAYKAFDGDPNSIWHSRYTPVVDKPPHDISVDLGRVVEMRGFTYLPRQKGGTNGIVGKYEFYVSRDGKDWGAPVASGTFPNEVSSKRVIQRVTFRHTVKARHVKFVALSALNGGPFGSAAEIDIVTTREMKPRPNR